MKPKTAAGLLGLAFENGDIEGFELACSLQPWAKESCSPLRLIEQHLAQAKASRATKVADARVFVQPYLSALAQYGYPATGPNLSGLRNADGASLIFYAGEALKYSGDHKHHALLLHRMVERNPTPPKCIKQLISMGFDKDFQDQGGNTPLHAVFNAMKKTQKPEKAHEYLIRVQALQQAGADFTLKNKAGVSAGDAISGILSGFAGYPEFCELLSSIQAQLLTANTPTVASRAPSRRL